MPYHAPVCLCTLLMWVGCVEQVSENGRCWFSGSQKYNTWLVETLQYALFTFELFLVLFLLSWLLRWSDLFAFRFRVVPFIYPFGLHWEHGCETADKWLHVYFQIFITQVLLFNKYECIYSTTLEYIHTYIHTYIQTPLAFNVYVNVGLAPIIATPTLISGVMGMMGL